MKLNILSGHKEFSKYFVYLFCLFGPPACTQGVASNDAKRSDSQIFAGENHLGVRRSAFNGKCIVGKPAIQKQSIFASRDSLPIVRSSDTLTRAEWNQAPVLLPSEGHNTQVNAEQFSKCTVTTEVDDWVEYNGAFTGVANIQIAYKIVRKPSQVNQPIIVILSGYAESYLLYSELLNDFIQQGYGVAIMDHRGMGLSGRLLDNPMKGYVENFDDYVNDAETFAKLAVGSNLHNSQNNSQKNKLYLFGHSTGGLIGAKLMVKNKKLFTSAVLVSPLMELKSRAVPAPIACAIINFCSFIGIKTEYAPGCHEDDYKKVVFETNRNTQSETRFYHMWWSRMQVPESRIGPPTIWWTKQILKETSDIIGIASKVKTPTLIFQAEQDSVVGPTGQQLYCQSRENCQLVTIPNARHNIHNERDDIRDGFLAKTFDFFRRS